MKSDKFHAVLHDVTADSDLGKQRTIPSVMDNDGSHPLQIDVISVNVCCLISSSFKTMPSACIYINGINRSGYFDYKPPCV